MSEDEARTIRIRELNDQLRKTSIGGEVVVAGELAYAEEGYRERVIYRVRIFNDFPLGNDPYGEHDFGKLKVGGEQVMWKIDYYDLSMSEHSPDPADPAVTRRVLSIYFAKDS